MPGKKIEVIGLNRWTVTMIQDSLAKYSPGDSLHTHACAAALRYKLSFADAAFISFRFDGDSVEQVVISLVEPQDSTRVKYRSVPLDTVSFRREWAQTVGIIREKPWVFDAAAASYLRRSEGVPPPLRQDSAEVADIWTFLESQTAEADAVLARQTLLSPDPSLYNRMIAASILLNFPESDSTWWALVETLLEEDGAAKGMAGSVLRQLARVSPRRVEWRPAAPTVHAILDGTSLFQLSQLIEVLNATGSDENFARPFLAGGGRMLVAYAGAEHQIVSTPARDLLVRLSGHDFGSDRTKWSTWIDQLQ